METRNIHVRELHGWALVSLQERVDSFNYDQVRGEIEALIASGRTQVAVDLAKAKFLSVPSIKYLSSLADVLRSQGGQLALLCPSEKLKRQIDIYASLDKMRLFRTLNDLDI